VTDILAALLDACARTPDAPAMTLGRRTIRYGELDRRVRSVAAGLQQRGLEPGDRVLFSVRPGLDGVSLALGIIAAGGTVVFADPGAGEAMFRARAGLAAPKWVAAEALLYAASSGPLRRIARRRGIELPDYGTVVPDARHIVAGQGIAGSWLPGVPRRAIPVSRLLPPTVAMKALARAARRDERVDLKGDPAAEALIIFTSGTTEHPKAVVHSRNSLGTGLQDFATAVGFVPGERVLTDQLMVGIPALIAGAHWMMPPPGLDPGASPEKYLGLLPDADVLFAVPAALDALLSKMAHGVTLRALLIGGAPVLRPLLERAQAQLPGAAIRAIYGMTEILPVAIADGAEKLAFTDAGDYVGRLMSHVEARIDDGELVVAGEGLAIGYLGQPPLVELHTGDLARIEGGRVILSGRSKDMFIRGTTNVYPGFYEPIIAGLPGVAEVAMAGIPNAIGDDEIVLAVVAGADFDEASLRKALPGLIDSAVLPDRIVVLEALPRAGRSSKLDRAALAELLR